jgi:multidrug transporter EmrE-like cation transporter
MRVMVLSALVILTSVSGNYFLSVGMKGSSGEPGWLGWVRVAAQPAILFGVALLISWMLLRLALLSATDMSLVLPLTAGIAYILTSLAGQFWLKETVTRSHNVGLALIAVGVILVGASAASEAGK